MQTLASVTLNEEARDRLHAIDIDVSCALRLSRVALQALAVVSDEARQAIERALAEEIAMTRIEDLAASDAVAAILSETRHNIVNAPRDRVSTAVRDIERLLIEQAADLACETSGPAHDIEARRSRPGGC